MTFDPTTNLLLPDDAKARWGKQVMDAGGGNFPKYPNVPVDSLPAKLHSLARRQWIVFQNGPYVNSEYARSVAGNMTHELIAA